MAIALKQHTDESSGALAARTTKLGSNAKIAYALFTGIVKDKIGYTIREYAKNAWEVSPAGKPFLVELPTKWSPRLRIRDYGPGLSHHFMMHRYPVLGESTKDGDGIGGVSGWGFGSKSALAYLMEDGLSGSYAVISYRAGTARHYIISLNAGGMPQVKHFMDVETEEPNGLEVSFAVREEDFDAFRDSAEEILWSFEPRPTVVPALDFGNPKVVAKAGNYTMFDPNTVPFSGPQVRVGPVMYPVDMKEISGSIGFLKPTDAIIFDLPPDQVSPTASREQLQYTSSTKRALSAMVQAYEKTFIDDVQGTVDKATCYFGGCKAFAETTSHLGQDRVKDLRSRISWGGQPIRTSITANVMHLEKGWASFDRFGREHVDPKEVANAKVVIEHNPYLSLDRFLALDLAGQDVLWARVKRADLPEFLSMCALTEDDVVILDRAPLQKRPSHTVGTKNNQIRRRRTLRIHPLDARHRVYSNDGMTTEGVETVDLSEGGFYLRKTFGWSMRRKDHYDLGPGYKKLNLGQLNFLMATMTDLGIIREEIPVMIDTGVDELSEDWVSFGDYIDLRLRDLLDMSQVTPISTTKKSSDIKYYVRDFYDFLAKYDKIPDDLLQFKAHYKSVQDSLSKVKEPPRTLSDTIFDALTTIVDGLARPVVSSGPDPIDALLREYELVKNKYSLLQAIRSGSEYSKRESNIEEYFKLLLNQKD